MIPYILCNVINCVKSRECYRYLAKTETGQLYHNFGVTLCNADNNYNYFMKIRDSDQLIDLDLPAIENIKDNILDNKEDGGEKVNEENLHG